MMEKLTKDHYRERAAAKVAAAQEVLATAVAYLVTGGRLANVPRFRGHAARLLGQQRDVDLRSACESV